MTGSVPDVVSAEWFNKLIAHYSEPHRAYHNGCHIAECLREFDLATHLTREPAAVEAAIWFHDAIYNPQASDNEERSAELARQYLFAIGAKTVFADSVATHILATKTHTAESNDSGVMLDIDLSILGQCEERFLEYEAAIRQEYAWVRDDIFREKRSEILTKFLQRPRLYVTDFFFVRYEKQARLNLEKSVRLLRM